MLYLISHFECDGHTVHMLTQWHLLPPLTSTVKLLLFTHLHSSPLSLTARLHDVAQTILVILTVAGLFLDRTLSLYVAYINILFCNNIHDLFRSILIKTLKTRLLSFLEFYIYLEKSMLYAVLPS